MATIGNRNRSYKNDDLQSMQGDYSGGLTSETTDTASLSQQSPQHHDQPSSMLPSTFPDYGIILQTPEGMAAIKECGRDSFWRRGLPFGLIAMAAERYATMAGYMKAARWPIPRTIGVGFTAFLLGRMSYMSHCRARLDRLWSSPEFDRYRVQTPQPQPQHGGVGSQPQPAYREQQSPVYDLDTTRNYSGPGLDDTYRPHLDNDMSSQSQVAGTERDGRGGKSYTSYEDLRALNRLEYERMVKERVGQRVGQSQGGQGQGAQGQPYPAPSSPEASPYQGPSNYNYTPPS